MTDRSFCVYAHCLDGIVKYIGEGSLERAYRKSRANHKLWQTTFKDKSFDVIILKEGLTKDEARVEELAFMELYKDTIINKKKNSFKPLFIDYDLVSKLVYYDEGSPTGLRWLAKNTNASKYRVGDIAGYKSKSGYCDITLNGKLYRVHRIIWVLLNKSLDQNLVIDHINGIKSDNRISNLRAVSSAQNNRNMVLGKPKTGIRNIAEVWSKNGISSFEVIWIEPKGKRRQKTFNVGKHGSAREALMGAYEFRDNLIDSGILGSRIKDDEPSIEDVINKYADAPISTRRIRKLPKSGIRRIAFEYCNGELKRFLVHYICPIENVQTCKSFNIENFESSKHALSAAYEFRQELLADGLFHERTTDGELSLDEALINIERYRDGS